MLERTPEGDVLVHLSPEERSLLLGLAGELRDDADDERGYRELAGDELLSGRRQALELLAATARSDRLSAEEADAWLRALNDLRLVLGTRLDVQEDMLLDAPQTPDLALYGYLSWLQEQLVAALSS